MTEESETLHHDATVFLVTLYGSWRY